MKYVCQYCGKLFQYNGHLQKHKNKHENNQLVRKPYTCNNCGASYSHQKRLTFHIRRECGKVGQCKKCGKYFAHLSSVSYHEKRCKL